MYRIFFDKRIDQVRTLYGMRRFDYKHVNGTMRKASDKANSLLHSSSVCFGKIILVPQALRRDKIRGWDQVPEETVG